MESTKKALYNSLKFRAAAGDIDASIAPWKVEDLQKRSLEDLFLLLEDEGFIFEKAAFKATGDDFDNPEEFTDFLLQDEEVAEDDYDRLYLIVFEIWRRLFVEKPSISIICDALDYQIFLYDQDKQENEIALQDALDAFYGLLEENVDHDIDPKEVFQTLKESFAHDIEHFLYDYISDLVDDAQDTYAEELIDQFVPFVSERLWFDLLRARIVNKHDSHKANALIREVFEEAKRTESLDLWFEIASLLIFGGDFELFKEVVSKILLEIDQEADFQDLLQICVEFFRNLDDEQKEKSIAKMLDERKAHHAPEEALKNKDEAIVLFKRLLLA